MKELLPLTRLELDKMVCHCGNCKDAELFLSGRCHQGAFVEGVYNKKTGIVTLSCSVCKKGVAQILVARALVTG